MAPDLTDRQRIIQEAFLRRYARPDATSAPTQRLPTMGAIEKPSKGGITGYSIPDPTLGEQVAETGASWMSPVDVPLALRGAKQAIGGDVSGGAGKLALSLAALLPVGKLAAKGAERLGVDVLGHGGGIRKAIVDHDGAPMRFYHGTAGDHTAFDAAFNGSVSSGGGPGFWFTPSQNYAWEYAENAAGLRGREPRIIQAELSAESPLTVNFDEHGRAVVDGRVMGWSRNSDATQYAKANGYDAVHWVDGSFTDDPAAVVFGNHQIRILDQDIKDHARGSAASVPAPSNNRGGS